jgi:hypothetical protein
MRRRSSTSSLSCSSGSFFQGRAPLLVCKCRENEQQHLRERVSSIEEQSASLKVADQQLGEIDDTGEDPFFAEIEMFVKTLDQVFAADNVGILSCRVTLDIEHGMVLAKDLL